MCGEVAWCWSGWWLSWLAAGCATLLGIANRDGVVGCMVQSWAAGCSVERWHRVPGGPDAASSIALAELWSARSKLRCYSFRCRAVWTCSQTMQVLLDEQSKDYSLLMMSSECWLYLGEALFYSVLPLVCLLCHWLVGRVCRHGQENDYRLPSAWKGPFLERSVERAAVRQGSYWICGVFPHNF